MNIINNIILSTIYLKSKFYFKIKPMIYKKIKDSNYIWNPETTLVFNKNRKVIGRYIEKEVVSDLESIRIAKENNIPIDISLDKKFNNESEENIIIQNDFDFEQKMDSSISISLDSLEGSFYDNHPAFQNDNIITPRPPSSISTDFIDLLTDEFRNKLNCRVNELIYKIMDLESTLKNLTDDYDQLLVENQQLKKQLEK